MFKVRPAEPKVIACKVFAHICFSDPKSNEPPGFLCSKHLDMLKKNCIQIKSACAINIAHKDSEIK